MSGRVLAGRYELLEKKGDGGMAVVYKAKDTYLNRFVAIKILKPEYIRDSKFVDNFRKESQAAAKLSHPNIVSVFDVGKEGNIYYIVMELLDGDSLGDVIEREAPISEKRVVEISKQLAAGLSAAHRKNIIHRDIKPHNILMTEDGTPKITDFGIAKAVNGGTMVQSSSIVMGSVHYLSPEQAKGGSVDARSDIYSLGIVMYEMLTGQVPYDGDNAVSVAVMHVNNDVPVPSSVNLYVSSQMDKIVQKATRRDPAERFSSADELIAALNGEKFASSEKKDTQIFQSAGAAGLAAGAAAGSGLSASAGDGGLDGVNAAAAGMSGRGQAGGAAGSAAGGYAPAGGGAGAQSGAGSAAPSAGAAGVAGGYGAVGNNGSNGSIGNSGGGSANNDFAELDELSAAGRKRKAGKGDSGSRRTAVLAVILALVCAIPLSLLVLHVLNGASAKKVEEVEVPPVTGVTQEQAIVLLEGVGLAVEISQDTVVSEEVEAGLVAATDPTAGTTVEKGSTVKLVLSSGPPEPDTVMVTVPNVVEMSLADAKSKLKLAGLSAGNVSNEHSDSIPEGYVISQSPGDGTEVEEGSAVSLVVSSGREIKNVKVPNLSGKTITEARNALESVGLVLGSVSEAESDETEGTVINQGVSAGTSIQEGETVSIVVSKGRPVEVPKETTVGYDIDFSNANDEVFSLTVTLTQSDGTVTHLINNEQHSKSEGGVELQMTGSGTGKVRVIMNGVQVAEDTINFN